MGLSDEIERLQQLRDSGALSEDEFAQAKARVLAGSGGGSGRRAPGVGDDSTIRWKAVAMHLSQFAGYLVPLAGFILPIVLWQSMKDDDPELDDHGRESVNWVISNVIYLAGSILLSFIGIGIPLLIVVAVLGLIFPVVAAIRAAEGKFWEYPLNLRLLAPPRDRAN